MLALGVRDEKIETMADFDSFFRTHFERVARAAVPRPPRRCSRRYGAGAFRRRAPRASCASKAPFAGRAPHDPRTRPEPRTRPSPRRQLLHGPARRRDLPGHRLVEPVQDGPDPFGILRVGQRGGTHEVGEQDGGDLPLLHADQFDSDGQGAGMELHEDRGRTIPEPSVSTPERRARARTRSASVAIPMDRRTMAVRCRYPRHDDVNRPVPRAHGDRRGAASISGPTVETEECVGQIVQTHEGRRHEPGAERSPAARPGEGRTKHEECEEDGERSGDAARGQDHPWMLRGQCPQVADVMSGCRVATSLQRAGQEPARARESAASPRA